MGKVPNTIWRLFSTKWVSRDLFIARSYNYVNYIVKIDIGDKVR